MGSQQHAMNGTARLAGRLAPAQPVRHLTGDEEKKETLPPSIEVWCGGLEVRVRVSVGGCQQTKQPTGLHAGSWIVGGGSKPPLSAVTPALSPHEFRFNRLARRTLPCLDRRMTGPGPCAGL